MKKISIEWLKAAEDDLALIQHIIEDEGLSHLVAFHAQQAIEKSLKAVIEEELEENIKTHSLDKLIGLTKDIIPLEYDDEVIASLESLYIDSRYPGTLGLLPEGKPSKQEAETFLKEAQLIIAQIVIYYQIKLDEY
jgi:HEPN domain-containing protein